MRGKFTLAAVVGLGVWLSGCDQGPQQPASADQVEAQQQAQSTGQAVAEVGLPQTPNHTEMKNLRDIYQLRDNPKLVTYEYFQSRDGYLLCVGKGQGFGFPYGTQYSNPHRVYQESGGANNDREATFIDQAEPNGLFPVGGTQATWQKMTDPKTGHVWPVYSEPDLFISPFEMTGPIVKLPLLQGHAQHLIPKAPVLVILDTVADLVRVT